MIKIPANGEEVSASSLILYDSILPVSAGFLLSLVTAH